MLTNANKYLYIILKKILYIMKYYEILFTYLLIYELSLTLVQELFL